MKRFVCEIHIEFNGQKGGYDIKIVSQTGSGPIETDEFHVNNLIEAGQVVDSLGKTAR